MSSARISRRSFLQLSGASLVGSALAACSTSAPPTGSQTSAGAGGSEAPAPESVSFLLWGLQYDPHVERYHMLADAFLEKSGAKAVVEPQAWPIEVKVIAAMAAGTTPDVTCIMGKQLVPLLQQNAIIPMEDEVFAPAGVNVREFFNPGSIGAYFYDGKYWGVPVEDNNVGFMVGVRTDWVEEAGADAQALWPVAADENAYAFESFEQMWELAAALQKTEGGNVTVWGLSGQGWDNRTWFGIMRDLGQNWWDPDSQTFYLNSEAAIEALRLYVTIPVVEREIETALDTHHMNALLAGKVAIGLGNNAMAGEAAKIDIPVESIIRPPVTPGQEPTFVGEGGWGFEVPVQAKQKETGVEFLRFIASEEGQYIWSGIYGGVMPASPLVMDSDVYQGEGPVKRSTRRGLQALKNTIYYGWGFGIPSEMENITSTAIQQARTGELTAEQAANQMQEEMEHHFQQWQEGNISVTG